MTNTPSIVKPHSAMPYVWALVILVLIGAVFILAILYLRPQTDPLILIPAVVGLAGLIFTQVATLMKTQETHATVNDASTEAKADIAARAHAEGMLKGAAEEQARIAKQTLVAAATGPVTPTPTTPEPLPVKVVATVPVPVVETPNKPSI